MLQQRIRKARALPAGARLPYALEPVYRRTPRPFIRVLERRLHLPGLSGFYRQAQQHRVDRHVTQLIGDGRDVGGYLPVEQGALLYAITRVLQPGVIVETGVASGVSSAFLLAAIHDNQHGRLVSIDLPFTTNGTEPVPLAGGSISLGQWSPIPAGKDPGWLVPDYLKQAWDLRLGDARELLPAAIEEHRGRVGFFFHDSLHTLEHMLFEFETAWPALTAGGVLASDDLGRRDIDALQRFAADIRRPFSVVGQVGLIRKPGYTT